MSAQVDNGKAPRSLYCSNSPIEALKVPEGTAYTQNTADTGALPR